MTREAAGAVQGKSIIVEYAIKMIGEKDREKKYWWFMYLSLFLVPNTKLVLRWFATQATPPTKEYYSEFWKAIVAESKLREVMLMVLIHHGLVVSEGPVLKVSQNGRDFLAFIGDQ